MNRLKGKIAIVTGAGQGIGAAIATRFAQEGADVMIAELNESQGRATAETISRQTGARVIAERCDVADPASVRAMVQETKERLGSADILVNNAGIAIFREPLEMTPDDWRRCMSVDLEGAWNCAQSVLPDMLARGDGAIINIISNHAFTVIKRTFPYPVAKHALLGLTRSLGLEYADRGIAFNRGAPRGRAGDPGTRELAFARTLRPADQAAQSPRPGMCHTLRT